MANIINCTKLNSKIKPNNISDCQKKYLVTEYEGVLKLESLKNLKFHNQESLYIKPSFDTISASGSNAAMVHYMPTIEQHDYIQHDKM